MRKRKHAASPLPNFPVAVLFFVLGIKLKVTQKLSKHSTSELQFQHPPTHTHTNTQLFKNLEIGSTLPMLALNSQSCPGKP